MIVRKRSIAALKQVNNVIQELKHENQVFIKHAESLPAANRCNSIHPSTDGKALGEKTRGNMRLEKAAQLILNSG